MMQLAIDRRKPKKLYDYHGSIEIDQIEQLWDNDEAPNYRWYITLPIKGRDQNSELTVILMNPSWTEKLKCDRTVWNIQDYVISSPLLQEIGKITVLNLFACRDVSSKALGTALSQGRAQEMVGMKTDFYFKGICKRASRIMIACGKIPGGQLAERHYLERLSQVRSILEELGKTASCVAETQEGYPIHARRWLEFRSSQLPAYSWRALARLRSNN